MESKNYVTAAELERQIFEKEEIRVLIRCPRDQKFPPYAYERKASANTTVNDWKATRLDNITENYDVEIVKGDGTINPHGRTKMETLRQTYVDTY